MAGTIEDNKHFKRSGRQRIVAVLDLQHQLARNLKKKILVLLCLASTSFS